VSAKHLCRDLADGRIKHLQRMRPTAVDPVLANDRAALPNKLTLPESKPRNLVQQALSQGRSGAGAHIRERGAQRRKDKVALQKALKRTDD
jgi:hypothetical protein